MSAEPLRRRLLGHRGGASALEFALVALPFIVTLFAAVEFGRLAYLRNALSHATAEAARTMVLDGSLTAGQVADAIADGMDLTDPAHLEAAISEAAAAGIAFRDVTIRYRHRFLVPSLFGSDVTLTEIVRVPLTNG